MLTFAKVDATINHVLHDPVFFFDSLHHNWWRSSPSYELIRGSNLWVSPLMYTLVFHKSLSWHWLYRNWLRRCRCSFKIVLADKHCALMTHVVVDMSGRTPSTSLVMTDELFWPEIWGFVKERGSSSEVAMLFSALLSESIFDLTF